MAGLVRRKFRRPVFSRLTLAWGGSVATFALTAGAIFGPDVLGANRERISLPITELETLAPAIAAPTSSPEGGLRLAAPGFKEPPPTDVMEPDAPIEDEPETLSEPELAFGDDALDDPAPVKADDIVITIDGVKLGAGAPVAASLTPIHARPVPNPDPDLLRDTVYGKIPKPAPDGRLAMHYYRNAFDGGDGAPRVSLVLSGLGLNKALTERAINELPAEVSLSFAPYARDLDFWTAKARKAGHEVLIELPMEHYGVDPEALGKAGLLTGRTPQENLQRLDWLLSRFSGYVAATNYQGGKFTADDEAIAPVLTKLREAGVGYFDDTGRADALANRTGASIAEVHHILPPAQDDSARRRIKTELAALEQKAKRDGETLAKAYAYNVTIDEIESWAKTLEKRGIELAPASALLP